MPGDRPSAYRVVIVTMDSHTAGPAARVQDRLAEDFPGLTVSVHAAAEWAENPGTLDAMCRVLECQPGDLLEWVDQVDDGDQGAEEPGDPGDS